jgi:hypothetical protein
MSAKTKKIFFITLCIAIAAVSALVLFFFEIRSQAQLLEEQVKILNENNTKESAFVRLKRLAQETEDDRTALTSSFFKSEGDSISFLGEVEALATTLGLSFETEMLEKIQDKEKREFVKMGFVFEGKKETVINFSKLLEVAPYHSRLESLQLSKESNGNWVAELSMQIMINSL